MKRKKITEPRNFGGQGAVAEKIVLQIRIPRSRFTKRKKIQVSEMKRKKGYRAAKFWGPFWGQGEVAEKKRIADSDSPTPID